MDMAQIPNRTVTVERLDLLSDMTDADIALNAEWVREVANAARVHMQRLRADLHKYKMADKNAEIKARRKLVEEAPQS